MANLQRMDDEASRTRGRLRRLLPALAVATLAIVAAAVAWGPPHSPADGFEAFEPASLPPTGVGQAGPAAALDHSVVESLQSTDELAMSGASVAAYAYGE
jgi:hypothetical protein